MKDFGSGSSLDITSVLPSFSQIRRGLDAEILVSLTGIRAF